MPDNSTPNIGTARLPMSSDKNFAGIFPAVATAFDESEQIDETAQRRLVNHLIDAGVHGLFPAGSTGESYALTTDEKKRVVSIAADEAGGRVPVLASAGAITTRECVALAEHAQEAGADGMEGSDSRPRRRAETRDALAHLFGGLVGEGDRQDVPRGDTLLNEVGDAVSDDARLSGTRPRKHQQRTLDMSNRLTLRLVQIIKQAVFHSSLYPCRT